MISIPSPFDGLQISRDRVCEFFAVFSRFEYSLKEIGYVWNQRGRATPDWKRFANEANSWLVISSGSSTEDAVKFITTEPPLVQLADRSWKLASLKGQTEIANAILATCRVRHNLFHGGKYTGHSPVGRDERLIESSMIILMACLEQNHDLRSAFETLPRGTPFGGEYELYG
jgi:hypothetical protein